MLDSTLIICCLTCGLCNFPTANTLCFCNYCLVSPYADILSKLLNNGNCNSLPLHLYSCCEWLLNAGWQVWRQPGGIGLVSTPLLPKQFWYILQENHDLSTCLPYRLYVSACESWWNVLLNNEYLRRAPKSKQNTHIFICMYIKPQQTTSDIPNTVYYVIFTDLKQKIQIYRSRLVFDWDSWDTFLIRF